MKTDVLTGNLNFSSLKPCDLSKFTKEEAKEYFNNTYDIYESVFYPIQDDSFYYLCPDRLRLPLIFYYGHTAVVYMNKLVLGGLVEPHERINFEYEMTFETGVDEMSWDDTEHYRMGGDYKWPTVAEVKEYRLKVKKLINDVIDRTPLELPVKWDSKLWALFMGFEHERIHLETSTVLLRQLPIHMLNVPETWKNGPFKLVNNPKPVSNQMIHVPATDVRLGKDFDFPSYGWDNEYGRVDCTVTAFEASKYKITNEEFLEFVKAKGYETQDYWTDEGWRWLQFRKIKHPLFWICPDGCKSGCGAKISSHIHCQANQYSDDELKAFKQFINNDISNNIQNDEASEKANKFRPEFPYKLRLMYEIVNMPYNWPVEIVYHEAKAYCKWKGEDYRLLTEAEHHAIRDKEEFSLETSSDIIYQNAKVNHNFVYGSSTPVDLYPANEKGFHDVFGNVWEWCEDHFNGLPGFKTTYLYDDFSTPCFDGRHNIIMGGSWASSGDEASRFARYMFRRHFLQHAGFRIARSIAPEDGSKANPQVRLVENSVFVLGAGFSDNQILLDQSKLVVEKYSTENKQYLLDSNLNALKNELEEEYGSKSQWFDDFYSQLEINLKAQKNGSTMLLAVNIGSSTGRLAFQLSKFYKSVVAVDYCGTFVDACLKLQTFGEYEFNLKPDETLKVDLKNNPNLKNVVFKQMTWVPNELPKSELVIFTMIDRVMNHLSWMKRFREVIDKHGLLVIYSKHGLWNHEKIEEIIGKDFYFINETTVDKKGLLSFWKHRA